MYNQPSGLAYTGTGTLVVGGVAVGLNWLILGAVIVIISGIIIVRVAARVQQAQ